MIHIEVELRDETAYGRRVELRAGEVAHAVAHEAQLHVDGHLAHRRLVIVDAVDDTCKLDLRHNRNLPGFSRIFCIEIEFSRILTYEYMQDFNILITPRAPGPNFYDSQGPRALNYKENKTKSSKI